MANNTTYFTAEASTLGFAPGCWPHFITYAGQQFSLLVVKRDREGDIMMVRYISKVNPAVTLEVFND